MASTVGWVSAGLVAYGGKVFVPATAQIDPALFNRQVGSLASPNYLRAETDDERRLREAWAEVNEIAPDGGK